MGLPAGSSTRICYGTLTVVIVHLPPRLIVPPRAVTVLEELDPVRLARAATLPAPG